MADAYGFAKSGTIDNDQESWMYIDVQGPGTVEFQWKVSSQPGCDYLEFWLDGQFQSGISGEHTWEPKSYTLTASGSHRLKWRYVKDYTDSEGDDCGYVKAVTWQPDPPAPTLAQALDSFLTYTTGGSANWQAKCWGETWDYAQSGAIGDSQQSWLETTVSGAGTFSFQWTVSSQQDYDYLEFYLDSVLQDAISGEVDGQQKSYPITGTGTHTLKWRYVKDSSDSGGDDRGEVDHVVWTGVIPNDPASDAWQKTVSYVYDAFGRRIEKKYDDLTVLKYVYDGAHCIAEYDAYNHVRRKYLYGPGIDQPISLIESTSTYAGTYYYHFDGLGSVVALSNSSGNTVEVYEYDVYGRPGASVPAHPNRIMFTGREYDQETGLYYYRARYYNPQIGRFLQTDPVGYGAGMNLYRYCQNNPLNSIDPLGLESEDKFCDGYLTADAAALAAGRQITGEPNQTVEYFYWIFSYLEDPSDPCSIKYGFTYPIPGTPTTVPIAEAVKAGEERIPCNNSATAIAWGHSHPEVEGWDTSSFGGLPGQKNPIPGGPTWPDGTWGDVGLSKQLAMNAYLLTPNQITWRYNVSDGSVELVGISGDPPAVI